jgi:hypothetical protein
MLIKESELRKIVRNTISGILRESLNYDDDDDNMFADDSEYDEDDFDGDLDYDSEPTADQLSSDAMLDEPEDINKSKMRKDKMDAIMFPQWQAAVAKGTFHGSYQDYRDKSAGRGKYADYDDDFSSNAYGSYDDDYFYEQ